MSPVVVPVSEHRDGDDSLRRGKTAIRGSRRNMGIGYGLVMGESELTEPAKTMKEKVGSPCPVSFNYFGRLGEGMNEPNEDEQAFS